MSYSVESIKDEKGDVSLFEKAIRTPSKDSIARDELELDPVEDKRILRKMDLHIIPYVAFLYLLSFLDRSNIGNAKIAGLVGDLKLKGLEYNVCAAVFFITYSAAEVPSNIALKMFRPSIWIPTIMLAWGIVMTLMSQVKSFKGLLVARIFLGLTEAGLFPGVSFFLTMWYRRKEQAFRIALFFSAATVAGAFGGLLAAALAKLDGRAGLQGWAWIFLVEGIFTVLVAIGSYFFMHDYPATAKFLTEAERAHVLERLRRDHPNLASHIDRRFVWQAFKDYRAYLLVATFTGVLVPLYAFSLFLPTIINGLGYTTVRAQLMSVPPYVGGCIMTVLVGYYSDKLHVRGPFIVASASVAIAGYAILLGTTSSGAGYAGAMIAALGVFPTIPCVTSWAGNNIGGDLKKGVVLAMVIGIGNLGGVCSSFIYMPKESPRYTTGHATAMGALGLSIICSIILMFDYHRMNKKKAEQCRRENIQRDRQSDFSDMGDASPLFRYVL